VKAKRKLEEFQEGKDYTVSYEDNGQKKIYNVCSLELKRTFWGDKIIGGFEYILEEDNDGVRTKMKMIDLGTQISHSQSYIGDNSKKNYWRKWN